MADQRICEACIRENKKCIHPEHKSNPEKCPEYQRRLDTGNPGSGNNSDGIQQNATPKKDTSKTDERNVNQQQKTSPLKKTKKNINTKNGGRS